MSKNDFYTPTDMDALRMENELLAFEVRFLKAHMAETQIIRQRLEECERSAAELKSQLETSEKDLALLLRRLGSSPLGPFFRTRTSFRRLERRYLDTDA